MSFTLEQKFKTMCSINRAAHFEWRQAFVEMYPDVDPLEAVLKYWSIVGKDTARAYLKNLDAGRNVAEQLGRMFVDSSLAMGEDAGLEVSGDEVWVIHAACPWYEWHKRYDALHEDQPGCDHWFQTVVAAVNEKLGTRIEVKTVSSLPNGDPCCKRVFLEV